MLNWDEEQKPESKIALNSSVAPVNVDDKRVINGNTDVNQLAPFKYPWAWEYFMNAKQKPLDAARREHDARRSRLPPPPEPGGKARV